jgi:O-methyltransferase involved in polyketide biosynthesis
MRDYSTISPSARSLLWMKGLTDIPFAKEAAALLLANEPKRADPAQMPDGFWLLVRHFEYRYRSIDTLMAGLSATDILELSSGFSFRGLALCRERNLYYIDTDLPEVIMIKRQFVSALDNVGAQGRYELQPLNVLDEPALDAIVARFPPGPLTIVNEGLLVYLDMPEKEKLCTIIRRVLLARGGCWITADVYIRDPEGDLASRISTTARDFLASHGVEEKKFAGFEEAQEFFQRMGFVIDAEMRPGRTQRTWRLVPA